MRYSRAPGGDSWGVGENFLRISEKNRSYAYFDEVFSHFLSYAKKKSEEENDK